MSQLPGMLEVPLYRQQALRLVREFHVVGSRASLFPEPAGGTGGRLPGPVLQDAWRKNGRESEPRG
jgi:hypothetical protein